MFILIISFCFTLISLGALGSDNELRIHNENEFITFFNSSSLYSGTTVYLESDLDFLGSFSNEFGPKNTFSGIFDGQGHTISNLKIKSSSNYVGLFGKLIGSIRNIIMDSSCSFTSNFTGNDNVYVGSVAGYYTPNNDTLIVNIINMANLTFEGNTSGNAGILYFGGVIGKVYSNNNVTVKNYINYGIITHSGIASVTASIGGIVGNSYASSKATIYIQNSLNYGTIINNGTSGTLYIGGIVGESTSTDFKNCVSASKIISDTGYNGGIVGYVYANTKITYCFWTSNVGCDNVYGYARYKPSIPNSSLVSINSTIVNELNEYTESNDGWNKWILNTNNVSVTFKVNNDEMLILSSQLILIPSVSDGKYMFDGWYTDPYCNEPFESTEVSEETTLYGLYGVIVTVTFNANGGSEIVPSSKKAVVNGTYDTLSTPTNRMGYTFIGWFNNNNENITKDSIISIADDYTLIAQWVPNNYTVLFNVNGGEELDIKEKDVTFNSPYGPLPTPNREGYTFVGWFNKGNESVSDTTIVSIADDHTLYAQWADNKNCVEIVLVTKDLTEDEIKDTIKQYTDNDDFEIIKIEESESGNTKVIIKFIDVESAKNFVETIRESSAMGTLVKIINFISGSVISFSSMSYSSPVFSFLVV